MNPLDYPNEDVAVQPDDGMKTVYVVISKIGDMVTVRCQPHEQAKWRAAAYAIFGDGVKVFTNEDIPF
ncbi:MAG: hypothetical protein CUN56_16395 [Phototrophicales bacterium]|nr:MAG: hypothetical protein CUN56_16395 [Phototrophicales bacterium]